MARAALFISIVAVLVSAVGLGWQVYRYWWEQKRHVRVEARSLKLVAESGERLDVVGVLVSNANPSYPIRVKAVAFSPTDQPPDLWFASDATIEPHDAETIEFTTDRISEVDPKPLGTEFVAWVELKTGERFRSKPHPAP